MKPSTAINAAIHFFNDIVGVLFPGFIFLLGTYLLGIVDGCQFGSGSWFPVVVMVLSYVVGHVVIGIADFLPSVEINIKKSPYVDFKAHVDKALKKKLRSTSEYNPHDYRSFAMSMDSEAGDLGRRFMFLSLLCSGTSAALFLNAVLSLFVLDFKGIESYGVLLIVLLFSFLFNKRGNYFKQLAFDTPFEVVLSSVLFNNNTNKEE